MLARLRARDVLVVLRRVLLVLGALELCYVLAGNLLLRSEVIKRAVASADGIHLEYGHAHTLWPGRVEMRDFALRFEDYNVQFELVFDQARVDISLSDLAFKVLRITSLRAQGTRFRMRHKLITVGDDAERVAAYPPIRGFADPPYFVGTRGAPISEERASELWEVRVEDVAAHFSELWAMEYRFVGKGTARGAFVIRPASWVQVTRASLDLESGRLTLGEHGLARHVRGRIECDVPDYRVQAVKGREVFKEISGRVALDLTGGKLGFLRAYLARLGSLRYAGDAAWQLAVRIERGKVAPGSRLSLRATPLSLLHEQAVISGDVMLSFGRLDPAAPDRLALAVSAPRLQTTTRNGAAGPTFDDVQASLLLDALDLTRDAALGPGQMAIGKLGVPDLAWFAPKGARLAGRASAELRLARDAAGKVSASTRFTAPELLVKRGEFTAQSRISGRAALTRAPGALESRVHELVVALNDATLQHGDRRSGPFALSVDASGLRVNSGDAPSARGALAVRVSSADALLPLLLGGVLREVSSSALDLKQLDARADLELQRDGLSLTRIDAHSGRLRVRGHVEKHREHATGALLLSSGPLHVGLNLRDGNTKLEPFVGSDWLNPAQPDS